jgi:hypothetical protein
VGKKQLGALLDSVDKRNLVELIKRKHFIVRFFEVESHLAARAVKIVLDHLSLRIGKLLLFVEFVGIHRHEVGAISSRTHLPSDISLHQFLKKLVRY